MRGLESDQVLNIALLTTGGTIDKTYDPLRGVLRNDVSVLDVMLEGMELEGIELHHIEVLNKDSLHMNEEDHLQIARVAIEEASRRDGVVIVHGTDRLTLTGEAIEASAVDGVDVPIVLTGAMRPWIMRNSDATQNLTESLLAVQLLSAGVFVCMHNRVLQFPGVQKDRKRLRFVYSSPHQEDG